MDLFGLGGLSRQILFGYYLSLFPILLMLQIISLFEIHG